MKRFNIFHKVLCEIDAYTVIEAASLEEALAKVAGMRGVTSCCTDYDIVGDVEIKSITVEEVKE